MACGLICTALLMHYFAPEPTGGEFAAPVGPEHPIVEQLANPTPLDLARLLFLAAVVAPICEEIVFRGVFYRHLREATGGMLGSVHTGGTVILARD